MVEPILIELPMPIETNRLIIKNPMPGDGKRINEAVLDSFEDLHAWMPWAAERPTVEESEISVRNAFAEWIKRDDLRLTIYDRATGLVAGGTGLHRINWKVRKFEIGYWVRSRFRGKGYISESTAALTKYAFEVLNANRVEIRCDAVNLKSRAIPDRLGFEHECTLKRDDLKVHGTELRDTLVFARFNGNGLPEIGAKWDT